MAEGRPPHPLFGGAGAKNMLAEAAKKMEQKRIENPTDDPRPSKQLAVIDGGSNENSARASRPPHPLMGSSGSSSLNNEILAMAAKRNARVNGEVPAEEPVRKHIEDVLPSQSKPLNAPTSTLAEQVALMAARRHNRLHGGASQEKETASPPEMKMRPIATEPLAPPPPKPKPSAAATATTSDNAPTEPKKKAWFSKKPEEPIAKARDYSDKKDVPSRPPAFQQAQLRKAEETPMSPTSPASPPTFTKAKLKPTGILLTEDKLDEGPPSESPVVVTEAASPMPVQRVVKEAVPAPPAQKIRTVTKTDPTFEVTEYKCVCVIL
ncbi:hypothetical protein FisN_25Lh017 [Fistulifera solaris]|uniref:Uncharacterized protein n=1 Tax=Fistulifera solaris TaxID=1519565 RepID=A0A1Z5JLD3_FISSO|nr:hypothetical protein FisN_25Lh017 [Fistulifera solaris]|eukprot:GAX14789.1 hypothetical protein FisN_25Lh017 [Fistulifera solaris]